VREKAQKVEEDTSDHSPATRRLLRDGGNPRKSSQGRRREAIGNQRVGKDGRLIDVSLTAMPIRDVNGNLTGICKIVRDVTERKQIGQALRESECLRLITENFTEVFWVGRLFPCPQFLAEAGRPRTDAPDPLL
jgi:hypothetical protein